MPEGTSPRTIGPTGVLFDVFAARHPRRFEPPFIEHAHSPDEFEFWAHQIQYAFPVDDPSTVAPLPSPLTGDDETAARRYVEQAEYLATTTVMNAEITLSTRVDEAGRTYTQANRPGRELIDGFNTCFRQFYDDGYRGYESLRDLLMRHALAALDANAEARAQAVTGWSRAIGLARNRRIDHRVLRMLVDDGEYTASEDELWFVDGRRQRGASDLSVLLRRDLSLSL